MNELIEIIRVGDGLLAVAVMVYFGRQLSDQLTQMQKNQQDIIMKLIAIIGDDDSEGKRSAS